MPFRITQENCDAPQIKKDINKMKFNMKDGVYVLPTSLEYKPNLFEMTELSGNKIHRYNLPTSELDLHPFTEATFMCNKNKGNNKCDCCKLVCNCDIDCCIGNSISLLVEYTNGLNKQTTLLYNSLPPDSIKFITSHNIEFNVSDTRCKLLKKLFKFEFHTDFLKMKLRQFSENYFTIKLKCSKLLSFLNKFGEENIRIQNILLRSNALLLREKNKSIKKQKIIDDLKNENELLKKKLKLKELMYESNEDNDSDDSDDKIINTEEPINNENCIIYKYQRLVDYIYKENLSLPEIVKRNNFSIIDKIKIKKNFINLNYQRNLLAHPVCEEINSDVDFLNNIINLY